MDKFFILSILGFLIVVQGVAGHMAYDNYGLVAELENLEIEDDGQLELSEVPSWTSEHGGKVLVNVDSFGAVGDGVSDDTQVVIYVVSK